MRHSEETIRFVLVGRAGGASRRRLFAHSRSPLAEMRSQNHRTRAITRGRVIWTRRGTCI